MGLIIERHGGRLLAGAALLITGLLLLFFGWPMLQPLLQPWQPLQVANVQPYTVQYARRLAHPYLAEYQQRLLISRPGAAPAVVNLPVNTSGHTQLRIYLDRVKDDIAAPPVDVLTVQDSSITMSVALQDASVRQYSGPSTQTPPLTGPPYELPVEPAMLLLGTVQEHPIDQHLVLIPQTH